MAETKQVDGISNLPDALLSEILSLLSTKEAVATSILSKRWESVWTKVPALNFSVNSKSLNGFNEFVDRVLICNDSPSLRLFQLYCFSRRGVNVLHYHSWIRNMMRRDIVEIDLQLDRGTLPAGTFSSEKLLVLKLTGFNSPYQETFQLPNLLTLHFSSIKFTDDFSFKDLLMSLPRLEELVIRTCKVLQNTCICSSSLKRLNVANNIIMSGEIEEYIIVAAPSLEYLCIDDDLSASDYKFGNMPSLAEARLHIECYVNVHKILKQASNLMTLELNVTTKGPLGDTERDQLPLFPNLTHLIITGDGNLVNLSNFSWRYLVLRILQRAPNLVSLDYSVLCGGFVYSLAKEDPLRLLLGPLQLPTCLPKCPIPTLEVVNISLFELAKADMILLVYLLRNAINLKVFRINLKGAVNERTMNAIARLFQVPRASSVCELIVSPPL